MANWNLSHCGSMSMPKQRQLCSAGSISNSPVCLCALQMKINALLQPTIILVSPEASMGNGFRSQEFIGRNRQARHRISLGQKFVKKRHTPGVSLTTDKSGARCSGHAEH